MIGLLTLSPSVVLYFENLLLTRWGQFVVSFWHRGRWEYGYFRLTPRIWRWDWSDNYSTAFRGGGPQPSFLVYVSVLKVGTVHYCSEDEYYNYLLCTPRIRRRGANRHCSSGRRVDSTTSLRRITPQSWRWWRVVIRSVRGRDTTVSVRVVPSIVTFGSSLFVGGRSPQLSPVHLSDLKDGGVPSLYRRWG